MRVNDVDFGVSYPQKINHYIQNWVKLFVSSIKESKGRLQDTKEGSRQKTSNSLSKFCNRYLNKVVVHNRKRVCAPMLTPDSCR